MSCIRVDFDKTDTTEMISRGQEWRGSVRCRGLLVLQVVFHIFKDAELKPLLDSANELHQKEKESEA